MPGGTRAYVRGSGGKFAGASTPGTKVTMGRAGGFANSAFRTRVQQHRAQHGSKTLSQQSKPKGQKHSVRNAIIGRPNSMKRRNFTIGVAKVGVGAVGTAVAFGGLSAAKNALGGRPRMEIVSLNGRTTKKVAGFAGASGRGPTHLFS